MKKLIVLAFAAACALPACAVVQEDDDKGGATVVRDRVPDTVIVRENEPDVDIHVR